MSPPRTRRRQALTALAVTLVVVLATISGARPASAQSVPHLAAQVTDEAGVLGGNSAQLDAALADLLDRGGVQLWVAFVAMTGSDTAPAFAQATFEGNGLGGNDLLLLVAVDDHRYGWWDDGSIPSLSSGAVDQLLSQTLEDRFRAGDYAGGVADFAGALADALTAPATSSPTARPTPDNNGGGTVTPSSNGGGSLVLLAIILVLAGLFVLVVGARQWLLGRRSAEERDRRTGDLARKANAGLVEADDAVRESAQDLGFAEAQFDEPDVAPLRQAIDASKAELRAAFTLRQQLDDAIPEDEATRERMLGEIVDRTQRVITALVEQRRRIQALREEEQKAPEILDKLPARISALEARLPAADQTLARLAAYDPTSTKAVAGNVAEARKRLADSSAETARGRAALAAVPPDPHAAGRSVRRVVGALAESTALLDAIERLADSLDEASSKMDGEIQAAAADLDAAKAAASSGPADADVSGRLAQAAALLDAAKQARSAPRPDVLGAVAKARQANDAADAILASVRETAAQRAREAAALTAALDSAERAVARASDYITTRRTGVGREARTRLAEAERHLASAKSLVATDPAQAKQEADAAARFADDAYHRAQSDFDDWDGRGGRRGPDLGQVILGGLILGNILGGGRRGGGWGGTPWGTPRGGGGWGGGGFGGGGFGGGRGGGGGWSIGGGGGGGGRGGGGGW
jgi:uncharacterized membrane protein YgcG